MEASRHTWWKNPEPNLRPTTMRPPSYMEGDHTSTTPVEGRHPVLMSDPDPNPGNPSSTEPGRGKPRTTIPVPVRSKQRVSSTVEPTTKEETKIVYPAGNSNVNGQGRGHSWPTPNHIRGHFQCPQFWWLWWRRSISSCFRPWHWSQLWPSWRDHIPWSPPPFLLVPPHLLWLQTPRHRLLPLIEPFSQIQLIHLVIHHSAHGPTQMIKSWWVWNKTQSPALLGRRSVPDFIAIPRYANWDGESWSKRLGLLTNTVVSTHPSNQRRKINWLTNITALSMREKSGPTCC